jgi:CPA1 family monovalent cation:H+ antiporter
MATVELVLALLAAVTLGGAIVKWTPFPLPILLVVVGAAMSFVSGFEATRVDPQLFLLLFIPPILFADAYALPRRDFVRVLKPVLLLALGLVVLTVVAIGYLLHWLIPGMPLAVAFTLGAIVSPTDAVATVATTETLPLPARVVHIVNAESLLNDASGLVAFKLAVAAAATGLFSSAQVAGQFVVLAGGGIVVGIAVEWAGRQLWRRLLRNDAGDPTVQSLLTVLMAYAAYIVAEALDVSGILAVVAGGLWASGQELMELTPQARRHLREVWRVVQFVLNGLVFVLLGLQLREMIAGVSAYEPLALVEYALVLWLALMALRLAWVYASAYLRFRTRWGWAGDRRGPDPRRVFLVGWAAVRGSITLATALSVPYLTSAGTPFPYRDLVVFLAASTIILTLALNGVPLPWIIRKLDLREDDGAAIEEQTARVEAARAGARAVERALTTLVQPEDVMFGNQLLREYEGRVQLHGSDPVQSEARGNRVAIRRQLRLAAIAAERAKLRQMRDGDVINDETRRVIESELDEREMLATSTTARG